MPYSPIKKSVDDEELYTHKEKLGKIGESIKEKAEREAENDAGKRANWLQKGNAKERSARAKALYDNPRSRQDDED